MTTSAHLSRPDTTSPQRTFVATFLIMFAVYLPTATFGYAQSVDSALTAFSAWSVAERGTFDLAEHRDHVQVNEIATGQTVDVNGKLYTNRFPGAIAAGVPFYMLAGFVGGGSEVPSLPMGGIAAATLSALAVAVLHLSFRRIVSPEKALSAAVLFGLGTATWSVSADALWTHGPAQLWLATGVLATAGGAYSGAGVAWGLALLTRPHLAVVPATAGIYHSVKTREWTPAIRIALASGVGLLCWLLYGRLMFGTWTLVGGYAPDGALADRLGSQSPFRPIVNLWWMIVHPLRGFLLYSPFLLWLLPALPKAWREAPNWVRSSALGGVAYLVAQAWINRWSGGDAYWGYRYAIESLTLAAPLMLLSYEQLPPHRRRIVLILTVIAIALQIPGAVFEVSF